MHPRIEASLWRVEESKREVLRRSLLDLCDAMEGLLARVDTKRVSRFAEHCGKVRDLASRDDLPSHCLIALADSLSVQGWKFADTFLPRDLADSGRPPSMSAAPDQGGELSRRP